MHCRRNAAGLGEANSDYVYIGKGKNDSMPADDVLAYENPEGLTDGINVLFGDGHVDWVAFEQVDKVFADGHATPPAH